MPLRVPDWAEKHRALLQGYPRGDEQNGAFHVKEIGLRIIISSGAGWEHASVSRMSRMPTYTDMEWVAQTFWEPTDTLMQLHVPKKDHINEYEYCLHWWRPVDDSRIPRPPDWMV